MAVAPVLALQREEPIVVSWPLAELLPGSSRRLYRQPGAQDRTAPSAF